MKNFDTYKALGERESTAQGISRRVFLASGLATGLSACARSPQLIGVEPTRQLSDAEIANRGHRIFIATTRARSNKEGEFYGGERSSTLGLAAVDVVVPPTHVPGSIERPRNVNVDPDKHFVITNPDVFADRQEFKSAVRSEVLKRPRGRRDAVLWVHGYNTDLTSAVLRLAQFVEDTGYHGVPILFSWASLSAITGYVYDMNSALIARDYLERVPQMVGDSALDGLDIIAHSMGNFLVMEAVRGVASRDRFNSTGKVRNVILASPDIDIDLFAVQLSSMPRRDRRLFVLVSEDDKALKVSQKIAKNPRVGQVSGDSLAKLGVNVIDLSEIEDPSSAHHSKFADSPEIVRLLGDRILAGDTYDENSSLSFGQSVVAGVGGGIQALDEIGG